MKQIQTNRFQKRIYAHHIPLVLIVLVSSAALYFTRPYSDVISRLSFATAYPALALLAATLLVGPWNVLRGRTTPVSSDLRRDIGIWAGIVGLLHAVIGQNVHLRGRPWLYYIYEHRKTGPTGLRHDLFGFNNFTGLCATIVLIVLLVTSSDWFLRRLGARKWKRIQQWNYACFVLTGVHALGYQFMEKQKAAFVLAAVNFLLVSLIFQVSGIVMSRRIRLRNLNCVTKVSS